MVYIRGAGVDSERGGREERGRASGEGETAREEGGGRASGEGKTAREGGRGIGGRTGSGGSSVVRAPDS